MKCLLCDKILRKKYIAMRMEKNKRIINKEHDICIDCADLLKKLVVEKKRKKNIYRFYDFANYYDNITFIKKER